MGKEQSAVKAPVVAPAKSGNKGKREAEQALDKAVSAKKHKINDDSVGQAVQKAKAETKSIKVDSNSSDDSSSEEKKEPPKKQAPALKNILLYFSSSDDSSSDEESSDDDEESSDDEKTTKKPAPTAAPVVAKEAESSDSSDDSLDSDSDSEDEKPAKAATETKKPVVAAKKEESSDDFEALLVIYQKAIKERTTAGVNYEKSQRKLYEATVELNRCQQVVDDTGTELDAAYKHVKKYRKRLRKAAAADIAAGNAAIEHASNTLPPPNANPNQPDNDAL